MKKKFLLEGLDCANCAAKIENSISKIEGLEGVTLNFLTTKLIIDGVEDKIPTILKEIEQRIKKIDSDIKIKEIK